MLAEMEMNFPGRSKLESWFEISVQVFCPSGKVPSVVHVLGAQLTTSVQLEICTAGPDM